MKPSFALNLSHDGVTLLHRSGRKWVDIGRVAFDDPDLPAALNYLRGSALGLAPQGIGTKLVIPRSEILYTRVHAPAADDTARRALIAEALEGRTPYDVADLVFDWSGDGDEVVVAVVARDTLDEAESFAVEHRFNPVSFVTIPEGDEFEGEPWFGPTALAPEILAPGEEVERDDGPIRIARRRADGAAGAEKATAAVTDTASEAAAPTEEAPAVPEDLPAPTDSAPADTGPADSAPAREPVPEPDPMPDPEPAPEPDPKPAPQPDPVAQAELSLPPAPPADTIAEPAEEAATDAAPARAAAETVEPSATVMPAPEAETGAAPPQARAAEAAPPAAQKPAPEPVPEPVSVVGHDLPQETTTADSPGGSAPTFTTRRPAPPPLSAPAARLASPGPVPPRPAPAAALAAKAAAAAKTARPGKAAKPAKPQRNVSGRPSQPEVTAKLAQVLARAQPEPATTDDPADPTGRAAARAAGATLGQFGSFRPEPVRGKPRYLGLMLTGVLLVVLVAIAVWAAVFLDDGATEDAALTPLTTEETGRTATLPPAETTPAPQDTATAQAEPEPAVEPEEPVTAEAAPEPAPAASAETGSVAAQAEAAEEGALVLGGRDTATEGGAPAMLAALPAQNPDATPPSPAPPPPFGTVYQFDAEGNILPTPGGVVTPDGVRLVAGKPPRLPPARPAAPEPAPEAAVAEAPVSDPDMPATAATEAEPEAAATTTAETPEAGPEAPATATAAEPAPVPADPRLAGARPRARPAGLVPPAPATPTGEDGALHDDAGAARTATAADPRPRHRPASLFAAAEAQAAAVSASASTAGLDRDAAAANPLVLTSSPRPAPRPKDLSRAVSAAVAAAMQASPPPTTRAVAAAPPARNAPAIQPEEEDEPEVTTVAPAIPTRASVAKQATFAKVINLSRINLIGVYGTSNNRYALVRQSNGRFVKVRVGDTLDGGRVTAIGQSDLRYDRRGQAVTLQMPKG